MGRRSGEGSPDGIIKPEEKGLVLYYNPNSRQLQILSLFPSFTGKNAEVWRRSGAATRQRRENLRTRALAPGQLQAGLAPLLPRPCGGLGGSWAHKRWVLRGCRLFSPEASSSLCPRLWVHTGGCGAVLGRLLTL